MERDYDSAAKTHLADLPPPEAIGRAAGQQAVRRLNPSKLPTGRAHVVYHPRAAVSLVGHLSGAVNGAAVARRTSFLQNSLGQAIFPAGISITDDPHRPRGLASHPFDGEGVAAEAFDVVRDGVLMRWFLDSATARELKLVTNGRAGRGGGNPSPRSTNLTLLPGAIGPQELIAQIGNGVYVTELIGQGVNGVTGDYSRGASGFRIVDGELGEAVSEFTIAGNLKDMYRRLQAASDLEYRFATNAPTLAVEDMTIAGR
jgi:PmbA protein